VRRFVLPVILATTIRILRSLLWVRHVRARHMTGAKQYIVSFWHAHLLLMLFSRFRRPIMVMSSQSKDGDLSAGTFEHFNVDVTRGSSTRGGTAALRDMLRAVSRGSNLAFTPDGPVGPPRIVKTGMIFAAQAAGIPIIPVAFAAKKKSYCIPGIG
jgi:lysophospholipid acyltransferase (LPLAT)-like uncharacterized protein